MSAKKSLHSLVRELRVLYCQTSPQSEGVRSFLTNKFPAFRDAYPSLPILVREATGTDARIVTRYDRGVESKVPVADLSATDIEKRLHDIVTNGPPPS